MEHVGITELCFEENGSATVVTANETTSVVSALAIQGDSTLDDPFFRIDALEMTPTGAILARSK